MKVCFFTLGCKVNQQETAAMVNIFRNAGYEVVHGDEKADVYVVNSCTVTLNGDRKSIQWIRRARRQNPDAIIALCGCMSQAFPEKAIAVKEADIIIGSKGKGGILELVENYRKNRERYINIVPHSKDDKFEELPSEDDTLHTRAFVKVEDGCNRACAYCVIPIARGRVRSRPIPSIVAEVEKMAAKGHKEVVLTGVNISCYGQDLKDVDISHAIEAVGKVEGIERVRLGSLELDMFTDEMLVRMSKVKEFCPHFHLSLQSGCDKTLKNMRRLYDSKLYWDMMNRMRELFVKPSFTTDIIVGFPQETEEDFLESVAFMQKCHFMRVHCFSYSQRPGTAGATMPGQLDNATKASRNKTMIYKSEQVRDIVYNEFIGFVDEALLEQKTEDGYFTAYTRRYIPVLVEDRGYKSGDLVNVKLTGIKDGKMLCEIVD